MNMCYESGYFIHTKHLDFNPTGIIDWSPVIEQILEKGRVAIKQTQHDKFTTLTSLLIHGL